ncbi:MAG: ribokinase [Arenimonas sp. SCN 70-307]|uniref:ribokinase n=1 Tax=Arenimonas sp. SCN 70-307 TaxID=1660089 RepID=UPI00086A9571|nr:ribokinase [Arenimonas sp. SCN 70-307]ODS64508.1 MAG: ribokinase [Arenimonas sp. SCN 70-307]
MGTVIVVGSYNQDHAWSSDELPAPGATRLGTYASGPGGKGFNQAVAAARAGARTAFVTALGEDAAAADARALARDEGIELHAEVHPALPSGTAGIFIDRAGRNIITVAPGANAALGTGFIDAMRPAFNGADVVLAQLEVAPAAVQAALARGREAGATTVLNPAPANAPTTPALLALADVLTPNETEFAALLARHAGGSVDPDALHAMPAEALHALCQSLQATTWVITLGGHGVFVSHAPGHHRRDDGACYRLAAEPAKPVDTTGAGDAFSGALCAALAASPRAPFREAVAFANRYAARSTENHGAALAMPHRGDLQD